MTDLFVVGGWRWRRFSACGVRADVFVAPNLTFEEGMVPISSAVCFSEEVTHTWMVSEDVCRIFEAVTIGDCV